MRCGESGPAAATAAPATLRAPERTAHRHGARPPGSGFPSGTRRSPFDTTNRPHVSHAEKCFVAGRKRGLKDLTSRLTPELVNAWRDYESVGQKLTRVAGCASFVLATTLPFSHCHTTSV